RAAMPGAGNAGPAAIIGEAALVERAAKVRALIGESEHIPALAEHGEGQVAELAPGEAAVGELVDAAQVMPPERRQVRHRFGVAGARTEAERQVPAQETARGHCGEAAERQQPAATVPARDPGEQ